MAFTCCFHHLDKTDDILKGSCMRPFRFARKKQPSDVMDLRSIYLALPTYETAITASDTRNRNWEASERQNRYFERFWSRKSFFWRVHKTKQSFGAFNLRNFKLTFATYEIVILAILPAHTTKPLSRLVRFNRVWINEALMLMKKKIGAASIPPSATKQTAPGLSSNPGPSKSSSSRNNSNSSSSNSNSSSNRSCSSSNSCSNRSCDDSRLFTVPQFLWGNKISNIGATSVQMIRNHRCSFAECPTSSRMEKRFGTRDTNGALFNII